MVSRMMLGAPVHARDLAGHYHFETGFDMGSELLLKPDGGFEFMLAHGAAEYWAKGTWEVLNRAVILNSYPASGKPPFRLARTARKATGGVRLFVVAPNGRRAPNIEVRLDHERGASETRTDSEGLAFFENVGQPIAASFRVRVCRFQSEPIALNPDHNEFSFVINADEITQVRFNQERLPIVEQTLAFCGLSLPETDLIVPYGLFIRAAASSTLCSSSR